MKQQSLQKKGLIPLQGLLELFLSFDGTKLSAQAFWTLVTEYAWTDATSQEEPDAMGVKGPGGASDSQINKTPYKLIINRK